MPSPNLAISSRSRRTNSRRSHSSSHSISARRCCSQGVSSSGDLSASRALSHSRRSRCCRSSDSETAAAPVAASSESPRMFSAASDRPQRSRVRTQRPMMAFASSIVQSPLPECTIALRSPRIVKRLRTSSRFRSGKFSRSPLTRLGMSARSTISSSGFLDWSACRISS